MGGNEEGVAELGKGERTLMPKEQETMELRKARQRSKCKDEKRRGLA